MLREGVGASYVGAERNGFVRGARCWVISDDGDALHVRWTSGPHEGQVMMLRESALAIDEMPMDDEFGFETPHVAVSINVASVYDRGGELALFEALQAEGHLDGLEERAREAVSSLAGWLRNDPTWIHVMSQLGEDGEDVVRSAVAAALTVATDGD